MKQKPVEGELTKQHIVAWYRTNFKKGTLVAGLRDSTKKPVLWLVNRPSVRSWDERVDDYEKKLQKRSWF